MNKARWLALVVPGVWLGLAAIAAQADEIPGIQVQQGKSPAGSATITVVVPEKFEVVLADGSGDKEVPSDAGITGFYDLANDPQLKLNLASPYSGLFSVKLDVEPRREGEPGAIMPGPGVIRVVEANPVRVVMSYVWAARAYGRRDKPINPDVRVEQVFAVYRPDKIYQVLRVIGTGEDVKVKSLDFVLHTSHAKFHPEGKSLEGGVYSVPSPWEFIPQPGDGPKTFILHVPKPGQDQVKSDFLLVFYQQSGQYSYRGNLWLGYRSSVAFAGTEDVIVQDKRLSWYAALFAGQDGIDSLAAAAPYVTEYRDDRAPKMQKGTAGQPAFDPGLGSYRFIARDGVVDFLLPVLTHQPVFEVSGWPGGAPKTIRIGDKEVRLGVDYLAGGQSGKLLLQYMEVLPAGTRVVIASQDTPEDKDWFKPVPGIPEE